MLPENTRWFAELFVSRLARAAAAGEADEELGAAVAPARLSKLHDRLTSRESNHTHRESVSASPASRRTATRTDADGSGVSTQAHERDTRAASFAPRVVDASSLRHASSKKHLAHESSFACLFPNAQRPFVRLIESLDSHRLAQALQRALVAALHALDPDAARVGASDSDDDDDYEYDSGDDSDEGEGETRGSNATDGTGTESSRREDREDRDESGGDLAPFAPLTLSPGGVVPSPPERRRRGKGRGKRTRLDTHTKASAAFTSGGGVTERALAARAVAGVLGVLHFGSGAAGAGATSAAALAPPPGIEPATALAKSAARGGLPLTVPWVLAFYRFLPWDAEAATAPCHLRALSVLRALRLSRELAPTHVTFGAPQMALRAVLADGLAVAAPTTPAARAAFVGTATSDFRNEHANSAANAGVRSGLALPPLAALPGLPPTRRDPRRYTYRGSPRENRGDETRRAAESSGAFVPVDRRYLEWACPSVDAAAARGWRARGGGGARAARRPRRRRARRDAFPDGAFAGAGELRRGGGVSRTTRDARRFEKRATGCLRALHAGAGRGVYYGSYYGVYTMGSTMGSTPPATPNAGNAAAPRRVVASRVDAAKVMTDSRTARARPDAAARARESVSPSETRASETRASIGSKEKKQKAVSAEKTERALQRAFLARHPTARRVVEFVADAAALAAADAASAVAADDAAVGADAAVAAAAAAAARRASRVRSGRRVVSGAGGRGGARGDGRRSRRAGARVETRRGGRRAPRGGGDESPARPGRGTSEEDAGRARRGRGSDAARGA